LIDYTENGRDFGESRGLDLAQLPGDVMAGEDLAHCRLRLGAALEDAGDTEMNTCDEDRSQYDKSAMRSPLPLRRPVAEPRRRRLDERP